MDYKIPIYFKQAILKFCGIYDTITDVVCHAVNVFDHAGDLQTGTSVHFRRPSHRLLTAIAAVTATIVIHGGELLLLHGESGPGSHVSPGGPAPDQQSAHQCPLLSVLQQPHALPGRIPQQLLQPVRCPLHLRHHLRQELRRQGPCRVLEGGGGQVAVLQLDGQVHSAPHRHPPEGGLHRHLVAPALHQAARTPQACLRRGPELVSHLVPLLCFVAG
mmetsp:Transcript_16144/g.22057  ORF Transcript_16144/g.22057 Transcript_16144/m.22057 type:complete len:217 (-) Transcript_16144:525-1175(-)